MNRASLSIVVPTLGESPTLGRVIRGLERQQPPLEGVELLVCVDRDGCEPALPTAARRSLPATVLHSDRPGASAARNVGWRAASAPLVLFLDDDIVPTHRLVAEHLGWHDDSAPEVGVLGRVRWSPEVRVTPFMRWLEMGIQFDYDRITGTDDAGWEHLYSCNVSIRREFLEKVGGFDEERFPFGYEDLDLGLRLARHGFRLRFNRAAEGQHLKTETLDSWRRKLARIAASEKQFVTVYPDRRPYFYDLFHGAAGAPPARGRGAWLARFIPPTVPGLGRRAWESYHTVCVQALAPEFLAAWDMATLAPTPGE